ncbi:MAG: beta-ketoacyl-[acyl-carrier-protein] synthase family protein, partial [Phycisphaerae bacterium]
IRQSLLKRLTVDHNNTPQTACRPFDADRTGTVISEGGGLVILEELQRARARQATIYAELVGFGASSNTHGWSEPHPEGRGLALAINKALSDARLEPEQLDLVVSFGCGLAEHDLSEARGIAAALGKRAAEVPVMAIKGAMGNNGAGSGAIDLAMACKAMQRGLIAPSQNTDQVDPQCRLNVVSGQPADARLETVLVVSYALGGGQNAALVLRRPDG